MQLSIVIPTTNRKDNIAKTIKCLLDQDKVPEHKFEIIVVDDNSTDGTNKVINKFDGIQVIKTSPRDTWNASIPRNLGAKSISGESEGILFLDSDIMLPPNRIQKLCDDYLADPDPNRVIIGPYHYMQNPIPYEKDWYLKDITNYARDVRWQSFEEHPVEEKNQGVGFALACFGGLLFIPKDLFFKSGGYDEKVTSGCEDGDFGLTLWETGAVFSMDKDLLGWHHPHEITESRTKDIPAMVKYIDEKHNMDLIKETGETYRKWGINWKPSEYE